MHWHELGRTRSGLVAPDFALRSGTGETITRTQFRQRTHLVLFFVPRDAAQTPAAPLRALGASRERFDEVSAHAFAIAEVPAGAPEFAWLLADPGGAVRASYAALFPEGHEPDADEPFVVVLDRYGAPWYAGHGALDDAAIDEALTKLWAIEYDCPE